MHDLVIDNARIVDGTGAPSRHGSVAVKDGRIVEVAAAAGQAARERVDAGGLAVAPGFIDPHTHYDAQLAWDPSRVQHSGSPNGKYQSVRQHRYGHRRLLFAGYTPTR